MGSIALDGLSVGTRLAYDVREASGRLLLGARRPLTEEVLAALKARGVVSLSVREWEELPRGVEVEGDARRAWLVADVAVTPGIDGGDAAEPGVDGWEAGERAREVARVRATLRRGAEDVVLYRSARWKRMAVRIEPEGASARAGGIGFVSVLQNEEAVRDRVGLVAAALGRLSEGGVLGAAAARALVEELIEEAERDGHSCVRALLDIAGRGEDLATRSYCVAGVAAAVAVRLGWSGRDALAAGLAGLFADAGAGLLAWDVRAAAQELSDVELNAVRRHPAYSAALLERVRAADESERLPEQVQLAVYQHHEREDGSGYPVGMKGERIHDAAKVVGVADVLVGLVSARADRPALDVAGALNEVARQANRGSLWRVGAAAAVELAAGRVVVRGGVRAAA